MTYQHVNSSSIEQVGYDASSATLAICFRNGAEYHYSPVSPELYQEMLVAPSVGRYFHEKIRNAGLHCQCVADRRLTH